MWQIQRPPSGFPRDERVFETDDFVTRMDRRRCRADSRKGDKRDMHSQRRRASQMRYGQTLALALVAVVSCLTLLVRAAPAGRQPVEMHAGVQLSSLNWQDTVSDGIWLVEHYSPYCHHCKAFAPTWIQSVQFKSFEVGEWNGEADRHSRLVNEMEETYKTINTHFGQVDCSVQGDLCDANNVKGYPSIFLYENGEFIEQFKKERTIEKLKKWLDARLPLINTSDTDDVDDPKPEPLPGDANKEAEQPVEADRTSSHSGSLVVSNTAGATGTSTSDSEATEKVKAPEPEVLHVQNIYKRVVPNRDGKLLSIKSESELDALLDSQSEAGPVFVKYFAPWCGHCKSLAPKWIDLASALKDKVNVVEFDCDTSQTKNKCKKEGVTGYPTLVFYNHGERMEYRGSRSLSQMQGFASKAALASGVRDMSPYEFVSVSQEEDVFFLYLYPANTPSSEIEYVKTAARTLVGTVPVFKSSAVDLFTQLNYPQTHPSLLVFKDHEAVPVASLNFTEPHSTSTKSDRLELQKEQWIAEISSWLSANKYPTLTELTSGNFNNYFEEGQRKSESYVAIAAISRKLLGGDELDKRLGDLGRIAKAWRSGLRFSPRTKPVNFVWIDHDTWAKYLASTYGMSAARAEPAVIIVDPTNEKFYPLDESKSPITLQGRQIFTSLEALYDGKLRAISTISRLEKVGRWLVFKLGFLVTAMGEHPILSMFLGLLAFVFIFSAFVYLVDVSESGPQQPPYHQPKYVNNGAGLYAPSSNSGVKKD